MFYSHRVIKNFDFDFEVTLYLMIFNLTCCLLVTDSEGVSFIARVTPTGREMVVDGALGPGAAHSWTRVSTLVLNTGQVTGTLLEGELDLSLGEEK